jgi:hypothetical protein
MAKKKRKYKMTAHEKGFVSGLAASLWDIIQHVDDANGFKTGIHANSVKLLIKGHTKLLDEIEAAKLIEEPV